MQIKALKVFCDIVARRSFSKAASDNDMSQSGASQIVHQLEEYLKVRLIDRSKRPFVLTPEGQVYYDGVKRLVQRFFALEEEVRTLHDEVSGRVTVASIYSVGLSHLSRFVQTFLAQHPKSNVRVEYQHPNRVAELVEQDRVDMGLVSYPRSTRSLKAIVLHEEPMVLVCSPQHPFAELQELRLNRLQGAALVGFDRELRIRTEIDRAFNDFHVEPRVVMEFDNVEIIKRAVEIDAGVSLLPLPTIEREVALGTLVAVPFEDIRMTRPIGIIHRRGKVMGRSARFFMNYLRSTADEAIARSEARDEPVVGASVQPANIAVDDLSSFTESVAEPKRANAATAAGGGGEDYHPGARQDASVRPVHEQSHARREAFADNAAELDADQSSSEVTSAQPIRTASNQSLPADHDRSAGVTASKDGESR